MKVYMLLRNNKVSGPFSGMELAILGLRPADLVWTESESTCWDYVSEVNELKAFIREPEPRPHYQIKKQDIPHGPVPCSGITTVYASTVKPFVQDTSRQDLAYHNETEKALNKGKKQKPLSAGELWKKTTYPFLDFLRITSLILGVVLGAIIIKKMVDSTSSSGDDMPPFVQTTMEMADRNGSHSLMPRQAVEQETKSSTSTLPGSASASHTHKLPDSYLP